MIDTVRTLKLISAACWLTAYALTSASAAPKLTVLHHFNGTSGAGPLSRLLMDPGGVLYGTTDFGGRFNKGTVFSLTPPTVGQTRWRQQVLHSFRGLGSGANPQSGLVMRPSGVLYGSTVNINDAPENVGTVFSLTPPPPGEKRWTKKVLHVFSNPVDVFPDSGLTLGPAGTLYGATLLGGTSNFGTVFKLIPRVSGRWKKEVLYSFPGSPNGRYFGSRSFMIKDADGALYGTTWFGGPTGCGIVFKLVPPDAEHPRWRGQRLHGFRAPPSPCQPESGIVRGQGGALYGTTNSGGKSGEGAVFMLAPPAAGETRWKLTTLHSFGGGKGGRRPISNVVIGQDGALYGTTWIGGASDNGVVFRLTPPPPGSNQWRENILHDFTGGRDGGRPFADPILGPDGTLYGTTREGGAFDKGTVYKVTQ